MRVARRPTRDDIARRIRGRLRRSQAAGTSGARDGTFTFDDGLIAGAKATADVFGSFGAFATFYVVTGWVRPRRVLYIRDSYNRGRDHGTWNDWRELARRGHEVGGHSFSHVNAGGRLGRRFPALVEWQMQRAARDLTRHLGKTPASCSMPWNAATSVAAKSARRWHSAMRLGGPRSTGRNATPPNDWYALESWAPDSDTPVRELSGRVRELAVGEWLIFQFHSLDGEGIHADRASVARADPRRHLGHAGYAHRDRGANALHCGTA